jgi:hypothetical protein
MRNILVLIFALHAQMAMADAAWESYLPDLQAKHPSDSELRDNAAVIHRLTGPLQKQSVSDPAGVPEYQKALDAITARYGQRLTLELLKVCKGGDEELSQVLYGNLLKLENREDLPLPEMVDAMQRLPWLADPPPSMQRKYYYPSVVIDRLSGDVSGALKIPGRDRPDFRILRNDPQDWYRRCLVLAEARAKDPAVSGAVKKAEGIFTFVRDESASKATTLIVELDGKKPPVWTHTWPDSPDGRNPMDLSQIVDGNVHGDDAAFLIETEDDLLWVKATRSGGGWRTDFAQPIHGAVSAMLRSRTVALNGCDRVVVGDDEGVAAIFTRNEAGEVFKDGKPFRNEKE